MDDEGVPPAGGAQPDNREDGAVPDDHTGNTVTGMMSAEKGETSTQRDQQDSELPAQQMASREFLVSLPLDLPEGSGLQHLGVVTSEVEPGSGEVAGRGAEEVEKEPEVEKVQEAEKNEEVEAIPRASGIWDSSSFADYDLSPMPSGFDDLAPLPEFDPDAPIPEINVLHDEDDELLAIPRDEERMEVDETEVENRDDTNRQDTVEEDQDEQQGGDDVEEEGREDEQETRDQPDSALLDLLRGLQGKGDEDDEEAAEDVAMTDDVTERRQSPSTSGSPLTPVPDLPSELPTDTELEPLAASASAEPESWAESSSTAAARAAMGLSTGLPTTAEKRKGKAPMRNGSAGEEELASGSEFEGEKRQKYKRQRGLDGKPIRSSKQPRKRLDAQLGILRDSEKPPDKVAPRAKTLSDAKLKQLLRGKTSEVQLAPCIRPRYGRWGKCTQCVSKIGGDQCRFRNYRVFPLDPATAEIKGPGTFESTTLDEAMTPLPSKFNTTLTEENIIRTEQTVAPLLLRYVTQELRHVVKHETIHRPVDTAKHRALCDFCASTVFGGFWFCRKCGRDYCLQCERYFSDSNEQMRESPWPLPDAARPRLHHCTRGPDSDLPTPATKPKGRQGRPFHHRGDLQATSRFTREEMVSNWLALVNYVLEPGEHFDFEARINALGLEGKDELSKAVHEWFSSQPVATASTPPRNDEHINALYDASRRLPHVQDLTGIKSHPFMVLDVDKLTTAEFDRLWARGEPMVVHGVGKRFKLDWSPDALMRHFGTQKSLVVDCRTEEKQVMTVAAFFTLFKQAGPPVTGGVGGAVPSAGSEKEKENGEHTPGIDTNGDVNTSADRDRATSTPLSPLPESSRRTSNLATPTPADTPSSREETSPFTGDTKRILKLKDWPMTNDFEYAYPFLYQDFSNALPVPDFTRHNGVLNLYSHFPQGPTRPDMGPKMYSAFASDEDIGSTRLHMDVADAVNIMLYASQREDGSPGCAVWDIFRAQDADKIRAFLKAKFPEEPYNDPIHSQWFYLDSELRKELNSTHGVTSFRVYQYPGQAVFIPAGCAHQVCNLANCIKIAQDFVSPHNVNRCQQLSQDFRKENFVRAWKDDVLQLYNVMWYAWTNVREKREEQKRKAAEEKAEREGREARLAKLRTGQSFQHHIASHAPFLSPATSSVRDDPARLANSATPHSPDPHTPDNDKGTTSTSVQDQEPLSRSKDKPDQSAAVPATQTTAATAISAADAKPKLAQKLMDAALAREPEPIVLEPSTVTGLHAQQQQLKRDAPAARLERMSVTPEPGFLNRDVGR